MLKRTEQGLIKVEVWKLRPARQHLRQDVVDEGDGLLGDVALLVTRRLQHTGGTELNSIRDEIQILLGGGQSAADGPQTLLLNDTHLVGCS